MKKDIRIAISGKSGCGNTTISKMVAETLNLQFINFTFRTLAAENKIDLKKVLELAAEDDHWDKEVDTRQVKIARDSACCVLGSRLAIWMLQEADLKIYLYAAEETRADRIAKREGGCLEEIAAFTKERDRQDQARYKRIYGIDTDDYSFVDLVIETDKLNPQQITDIIVERAKGIERQIKS